MTKAEMAREIELLTSENGCLKKQGKVDRRARKAPPTTSSKREVKSNRFQNRLFKHANGLAHAEMDMRYAWIEHKRLVSRLGRAV